MDEPNIESKKQWNYTFLYLGNAGSDCCSASCLTYRIGNTIRDAKKVLKKIIKFKFIKTRLLILWHSKVIFTTIHCISLFFTEYACLLQIKTILNWFNALIAAIDTGNKYKPTTLTFAIKLLTLLCNSDENISVLEGDELIQRYANLKRTRSLTTKCKWSL